MAATEEISLLHCTLGLHGKSNKDSSTNFLFDDFQIPSQCCEIKCRLAKVIENLKSHLTRTSISSLDVKKRALESYYRSRFLHNACKLSFISSDAEQCAYIMEFQEQLKFRKLMEPLTLGTHLLRWPIYQRGLHSFFFWEPDGATVVSSPQVIDDPLSSLSFPNELRNWPVPYIAPSTVPSGSKLTDFQFNLVVITRGTLNLWKWHRELLDRLINCQQFGQIGINHNLLFPLFFSDAVGQPNFVSEDILRYSFVLSANGLYVGDLALKLILPIIFVVNQLLTKANDELSETLTHLPTKISHSDITEYVIGFYDLFNTSIHLVTYPALNTVLTRHYKNNQLFQGLIDLVVSLSKCAICLFSRIPLLLLNAELSISGVPLNLKINCTVDEEMCSSLFKYSSVEGLLNCGFRWVGNHFCEAFANTNLGYDRIAAKAAIDYLVAYFKIFLSNCDFEINIEQAQLTKFRFNRELGLYEKQCINLDEDSHKEGTNIVLPVQCLTTDALRFVQILFDYTPIEGNFEVTGKGLLFIVFLRLCLNRIFLITDYSEDPEKPGCLPAYPFKRWITVSEKDRFGNDVARFINPFQPLYSILRPAQFWLRVNKNDIDFENLMPLYCEVIFQLFNPLANIAIRLSPESLDKVDTYNCRDLLEWVIKVGNFMKRKNEYEDTLFTDKSLFKMLKYYWRGFVLDKNWGVLLGEKAKAIASTKISGHYGTLQVYNRLMSRELQLQLYSRLMSNGLQRPAYEFGGSYADPIFEALHMQVSMLLFSPSQLSQQQFVYHLTNFACLAHPLSPLSFQSPLIYFKISNEADNQHNALETLSLNDAKSIEDVKNKNTNINRHFNALSKNLLDVLLIYSSGLAQPAHENQFTGEVDNTDTNIRMRMPDEISISSSQLASSFSSLNLDSPSQEPGASHSLSIPTPEQIQQLNRILRLDAPVTLNTLDQYAPPIMSPLHSDSSFEPIRMECVENIRNRTTPEYLTSQSWSGPSGTKQ